MGSGNHSMCLVNCGRILLFSCNLCRTLIHSWPDDINSCIHRVTNDDDIEQ